MSLDALRWALGAQTPSPSHKLVLISMADRAGEEMECYPSQERLERDTQLNIKTVKKCLRELEEQGFITDTGKRTGKTNRTKIFQLTGVDLRELEPFQPAQKRTDYVNKPKSGSITDNKPENGLIKSGQKRADSKANEPKSGLNNEPKNGLIKSAQIRATEPPSILTTQYNHPTKTFCASGSDEPETLITETNVPELPDCSTEQPVDQYVTAKGRKLSGENWKNFEMFWDVFDYRKDKARAADAWLKIRWAGRGEPNAAEHNRELFAAIIAGASFEAMQRESKLEANQTPIYPEGWLTGRRWEDEHPDLRAQQVALQNELAAVTHTVPKTNREQMRAALRDITATNW
jgi:DNA-binding PadR family transcriptional regulator